MQRFILIFSLIFCSMIAIAQEIPHKMRLNFVGPFQVPATMDFQYGNGKYQLKTIVNIPFKKMVFESEGTMQGNRLITQKFRDIRSNKPYAYADFDTQNRTITYGRAGEQLSAEMTKLAQDFFTTAWQSALNKGPLTEKIQTTNGKKIYERPTFTEAGTQVARINGKSTTIKLYVSGEGDDRVELGLAPADYYLPALIAYYEKGKRYELNLRSYTAE